MVEEPISDYAIKPAVDFVTAEPRVVSANDSMIEAVRVKRETNPHFVDDVDLAVIALCSSFSDTAID